ncbi:hypothetical protein MKW94_026401 [Papaver nudicaule]|uniref:Uncharacterized protein n=1 Tax=Papaver nudicaule TaxID=74823 RepID=A0AA42AY70_PAPNU|nr:hypothetical protein [Papaver nudicaule]
MICIAAVVVMVIAIAQHHVVEAEPGFGGCHGKCTDECVEEGFDKPFCSLKYSLQMLHNSNEITDATSIR